MSLLELEVLIEIHVTLKILRYLLRHHSYFCLRNFVLNLPNLILNLFCWNNQNLIKLLSHIVNLTLKSVLIKSNILVKWSRHILSLLPTLTFLKYYCLIRKSLFSKVPNKLLELFSYFLRLQLPLIQFLQSLDVSVKRPLVENLIKDCFH